MVGCSTEDVENGLLGTQQEIKLTTNITAPTRGIVIDEQNTLINDQQEVGVTILGASETHNNVKWVSDGFGGLRNTGNPIYYSSNNSIEAYAYQPYNSSWKDVKNSSYLFTVSDDQSLEGYANSDLLWASPTSATSSNSSVGITFNHMLSKINVFLTSTDGTDLSNASITLNNVEMSARFKNGTISNIIGNRGDVLAGTTTDKATAIIAPQTINKDETFITIQLGDRTFEYKPKASRTVESGKVYSYRLKVNSSGQIVLDETAVNPWEDGNNSNNTDNSAIQARISIYLSNVKSTTGEKINGAFALYDVKYNADGSASPQVLTVTIKANGYEDLVTLVTIPTEVEPGQYLVLTLSDVVLKPTGGFSEEDYENGSLNGHEYVDLDITDENGNKVLWATTNVGAENPWEYGGYYAWGETKAYGEEDTSNAHNYAYGNTYKKNYYDWSTYKWATGSDSNSISKYSHADGRTDCYWYNNDGNYVGLELDGNKAHTVLDEEDDAATVNWGYGWRMPTSSELSSLVSKCCWVWVTSYKGNAVNGYVVYEAKCEDDKGYHGSSPSESYSVITDAHIFLPAAGYRNSGNLDLESDYGNYWSSNLDSYSSCAQNLYFDSSNHVDTTFFFVRYYGMSVRPVHVKQD